MAMEHENYQLTRNDFELCAKNAFKNLLGEQEFSDVTLACSNNKQVKAHKVILGACSPFFKEILLNNPHQNPLIYLKGIGIDDLEAILKFIYQGQTSISEANLDSFLASAQELQVEGLLLAKNEASRKANDRPASEQKSAIEMPQLVESLDTPEDLDSISNYLMKSKVLPSNQSPCKILPSTSSPTPGNKFKCSVCDFETLYRKSLKRHKETVHAHTIQQNDNAGVVDTSEEDLDSISNYLINSKVLPSNPSPCEFLPSNSSPTAGNKFKCSVCDFETLYRKSLKRHKETVHAQPIQQNDNAIMMDTSEKLLSEDLNLTPSENSEEEIQIFPNNEPYKCETCDFTTKHKWNIKRHVDRVHPVSSQKNMDESLSKPSENETPMRSVSSYSPSKSFNSPIEESFVNRTSFDESITKNDHSDIGDVEVAEPKNENKHQCDHCEFATTHKKNLNRHVLRLHGNQVKDEVNTSKEENVPAQETIIEPVIPSTSATSGHSSSADAFTYTCDKCDFTSDNKWNLTRHILRIHKEMKYPCDYCDYKAGQTYRLKEHMQKKHI
eukprot:GFUD01019797.1.p1 GENE.GFUD01019797.1~~GFUD01019797.1.p1  ORF type:complete len:554 (-),score=90.87 GFUD01019797.1:6-1667(-)